MQSCDKIVVDKTATSHHMHAWCLHFAWCLLLACKQYIYTCTRCNYNFKFLLNRTCYASESDDQHRCNGIRNFLDLVEKINTSFQIFII